MKLIPGSFSSSHQQLIVLAPSSARIPEGFRNVVVDPLRHGEILADMQKMRGRIYLDDGAIAPWQLQVDGRHCSPADEGSWHLLTLDDHGNVSGCVRYREHLNPTAFHELGLRESALARCGQWRTKFEAAVESDMAVARKQAISFVEVGGWALAKERRCTGEALRTALATYSLAEILGGCIGFATATVRHRSASILRRIGGQPLEFGGETLPAYYDPQYKCEMEIVRFKSDAPNHKYRRWIDQISAGLLDVPVLSLPSVGDPQTAALA
jgi:hypothetical protein